MKHAPRGLTLVELMVSMAILMEVLAMAAGLLLLGVRAKRAGEETADTTDAARFAGDVLADALKMAGLGASGGLYVYDGTDTRLTSPIIGLNNTTAGDAVAGSDELWVVVPHRNAFQESCSSDPLDLGAATMLHSSGTGPFVVRCKDSLDHSTIPKTLMMVSNMTTAALITGVGFAPMAPDPGFQVTYNESGVANFSSAPARGGYQAGDLLFPATVRRYFVKLNTETNRRALMVQAAVPKTSGGSATAVPFQASPEQISVVQEDIEDLQIAFGVDPTNGTDPASIQWINGLGPAYSNGVRSVRITVVARSARVYRDDLGNAMRSSDYQAKTKVEDHVITSPVPDGHRRILYTRRVELPNMAPANL